MKTNFICVVILLTVCFTSCKKENDKLSEPEGAIQLGLSLPQQSTLKSVASNETPRAILISIADSKGQIVIESKKVTLINMNGSYLSEPLSFVTGNYYITKFVVLNNSDSAIYATPLKDSKLAYLVSTPLPIGFSISKDNVTKLIPEVISVRNANFEDFGYDSFSFILVKTFDFLTTVMIYNETIKNWELTSANIIIKATDGTIAFHDSLAAITNQITICDNATTYSIAVSKKGYMNYVRIFTNDELKQYGSNKKPLVMILEKDVNTSPIWTNYTSSNGLASNIVNAIGIDYQGNKWFGTWGGGVSKFDGTNWTTYTTSNGLAHNIAWGISIDALGNKWFSTFDGASKFDGSVWTTFKSTNGLPSSTVFTIGIDKQGNKWFGTNNGIAKFDGINWSTYKTGYLFNVNTIAFDDQNNIWFGTTKGVLKFDGNNWITYTTTDGLANDQVFSIVIDSLDNKWFATNDGISMFNGTNWFTYKFNFVSTNVYLSAAIDYDGNLWFGNNGSGVLKFDGTKWTRFSTTNSGLINNQVLSIAIDSKNNKWFGTGGGVSKLED